MVDVSSEGPVFCHASTRKRKKSGKACGIAPHKDCCNQIILKGSRFKVRLSEKFIINHERPGVNANAPSKGRFFEPFLNNSAIIAFLPHTTGVQRSKRAILIDATRDCKSATARFVFWCRARGLHGGPDRNPIFPGFPTMFLCTSRSIF